MPSNAAILVDRTQCTHGRPLFHGHMSCQRGAVGEDTVVTDIRIMPDVRIRHDQAIPAHARHPATSRCSARDGDALADHCLPADLDAGWLTGILQILWRDTY